MANKIATLLIIFLLIPFSSFGFEQPKAAELKEKMKTVNSWNLYEKRIIIKDPLIGQYILSVLKSQDGDKSALILSLRYQDTTEKILQIFDWDKKNERFTPFFIDEEVRKLKNNTYQLEDSYVVFNRDIPIAKKDYFLVIIKNPNTSDEELRIYSRKGNHKIRIHQKLMWTGVKILDYYEPITLGERIETPNSLDAWYAVNCCSL